jgi:peptidoglycan hydrolase-like protein with peptidoglycan-binding domain
VKGILVGGGVAVLLAATAVGLAVGLPTDGGKPVQAAVAPQTAKVTRQTLADTETKSGTLGYGSSSNATAKVGGTVTGVAAQGAVIRRGQALYRVDEQPVVLLYGLLPAYRVLRNGVEGADVAQFERNLKALGYTGFTVDNKFNAATAAAVRKWQDKLGLPKTGVVEPGRITYAADAVRVESVKAAVGDQVQPGGTVLTYTGTQRAVTVELGVDDERLAKLNATVKVQLPDGKQVDGVVRRTRTVIEPGSNGGDPTTTIEVTVAVSDPAVVGSLDQATVRVEFVASTRENVLTVPVAALLALREGGYGVEVVSGSSSTIVAVTTGLFAGGQVEVSGDGLAEGATVGMPS